MVYLIFFPFNAIARSVLLIAVYVYPVNHGALFQFHKVSHKFQNLLVESKFCYYLQSVHDF